MAQGEVRLLNILMELTDTEMKMLKWYLNHSNLDGYPPLAKSRLDKATERWDTVDLLVQTYSLEGALVITAHILKQMNRNDLVEKLQTAGADMEPTAQEEERQTESHLEKNHRTGDEERRAVLATSGAEGTSQDLCKISPVAVLLTPKPGTREYFFQYARPLSLDPNTVSNGLSLSKQNMKVTQTGNNQRYAPHPERFTNYPQVLCREGQSARCYWEVEWSGPWVDTAVCYRDMRRDDVPADVPASGFGYNNKSWCLLSYSYRSWARGYRFSHNSVQTTVSGPRSSRIGVYLDHKAGTLSFYSVSDTMTLLHTVQTTFTHTLYPGISVDSGGGTAELMKIW